MAAQMVRKLVRPESAPQQGRLELLSEREFEVFNLIGKGIGPSDIAERLGLSVKTIESYRERIKEKLSLKTGAELVRYAVKWAIEHD
jgi:DNA-binding NarL/FixJ family response regulator